MSDFDFIFDLAMLPAHWWMGIVTLAVLVLALIAWQLPSLLLSRVIALAVLAFLFIAPYLSHELLVPLDPIALIIVDQSPSMQLGNRQEQTRSALENLQNKLRIHEKLQVERYDIGTENKNSTHIFGELLPILKKYNPRQLAAVFLITDGQIDDVPVLQAWPTDVPLQVLLVGEPDAQYVFMELEPTQPYASVGQKVPIRIRAHWRTTDINSASTLLTVENGSEKLTQKIADNTWHTFFLPVTHPGLNQFILQLPKFNDAIFPAAQTRLVNIYGVQNKIRILWQGTATNIPNWLSQLKADEKISLRTAAANNTNFDDIDVLILDQPFNQANGASNWQAALVEYINQGGAVLFLQDNPPQQPISPALQEILPVKWSTFIPVTQEDSITVTAVGLTHPITGNLADEISGLPVHVNAVGNPDSDSNVLLIDQNHHVILAAGSYRQNRIIAITDGSLFAAPFGALLLRHSLLWLLHDPNFETHTISAIPQGHGFRIEYSGDSAILALQVTKADRSRFELPLVDTKSGLKMADFNPDQIGIYRISDGSNEIIFTNGDPQEPEWQNSVATPNKLRSLVTATGGQILWLKNIPDPDVRFVTWRQSGGADWFALRQSRAALVTGSTLSTLLPKPLLLCLVLAALSYAWWREGR